MPGPDRLDVLLRLERQRLDQARRDLQALAAKIAPLRERLDELRANRRRERAIAQAQPGDAAMLERYLEASGRRGRELFARLERLETARAAQIEGLRARRFALKRLEILAERRRRRAAAEAARREQRTIDDLVLARRAAARSRR